MKMRLVSLLLPALLVIPALGQAPGQAPAAKTMSRDEVFFSIGRRINSISESPVSAIVTELDGLIEVTSVTAEPDGRSLVTVKERTPSSAAFTNKSTRLRFAPPPPGGKDWSWVEFEENRRFYPVDKIFPYAKDELNRRKQASAAKWTAYLAALGREVESAIKVIETAKAVLKTELPGIPTLTAIRLNLAGAIKENDRDGIALANRDIGAQSESVTGLADNYTDLKANDAYLRLIEEYKGSITAKENSRREYAESVAAYNEVLLRLPYALVAYGSGFTRIEARIE